VDRLHPGAFPVIAWGSLHAVSVVQALPLEPLVPFVTPSPVQPTPAQIQHHRVNLNAEPGRKSPPVCNSASTGSLHDHCREAAWLRLSPLDYIFPPAGSHERRLSYYTAMYRRRLLTRAGENREMRLSFDCLVVHLAVVRLLFHPYRAT
jgi:hypothetical protein